MERNKENLGSFKERLSEALSYQGISHKEFASQIGISINTLNMYLYRDSIPSADIAVKMASVLNTTTEYLVTGKSQNFKTQPEWQKIEILNIINTMNQKQLKSFLDIARAYKESFEQIV